jgi:hypothetical protein
MYVQEVSLIFFLGKADHGVFILVGTGSDRPPLLLSYHSEIATSPPSLFVFLFSKWQVEAMPI